MIKIYKKGNYIILENPLNGKEISSGLAKLVQIHPIGDDK